MTIKARPTVYRGIQMRSRLEAAVAGRLDEGGFDWEYEPKVFAGRRGQYLPDFLVKGTGAGDLYLEVKPTIEAALRILPRMQVIRESEPDALLVVEVAGDSGRGAYQLRRGSDQWLWFAVP